jgi:hypothetical protein
VNPGPELAKRSSPSICPCSPECVEGVFSEVCIQHPV